MRFSSRLLIILLLCLAPVVAVFLFWPNLDLKIAGWIAGESGRFELARSPARVFYTGWLRPSLRYILIGVGLWVAWRLWSRPERRRLYLRRLIYLGLVILIGPVLIVEAGLKSHSGRARPAKIENFGGQMEYSPPFVFTDQCATNCSFVSNDVGGAFVVFALALLAVRRRTAWVSLAISTGLLVGLWRMLLGAHFFSDVVLAGFIVMLVSALCYRFVIEDSPADPRRQEATF